MRWLALVVVALLLSAPEEARAAPLSTGDIEVIAFGAAVAVVDLTLLTYDLVRAGLDRRPHYRMAILESTLMLPQIVIGISVVASTIGTQYGGNDPSLLLPIGVISTLLGGALLAHGFWGARHATDGPQAVIVPTAIGGRAAGVALVGRF